MVGGLRARYSHALLAAHKTKCEKRNNAGARARDWVNKRVVYSRLRTALGCLRMAVLIPRRRNLVRNAWRGVKHAPDDTGSKWVVYGWPRVVCG